jgi:translocator protein
MTTLSRPESRGGLLSAVVSIAIALAVGAVGGLATAASVATWYAGLNKPAFNPPNVVFAPVWTILYVLMALAAWRVWRSPASPRDRRIVLIVYSLQLALNLAWSLIFFGMRAPLGALVEVFALLASVLLCTACFWRLDRLAGWLMCPYAAWVAFASALNFEIWRLN